MPTILYPAKDGPVGIYPNSLSPYLGAVLFEAFLYGIYVVLFCFSLSVVFRKDRYRWFWLTTTIVLLAIATADVGYTAWLLLSRLEAHGLTFEDLRPKYMMYVVNSTIADIVLLRRCYLIWSSNMYVVIGPSILLFAATVCGFVFEGTTIALSQYSWINVSLSVIVNVVITTLAAGRIVYVARATPGPKYHGIVITIIESGAIYTVYVSLNLVFWQHPTAHILLDAGLIQVLSIIPTLLIVQSSVCQQPLAALPSPQRILGFGPSNSDTFELSSRGNYGGTPFSQGTPVTGSVRVSQPHSAPDLA